MSCRAMAPRRLGTARALTPDATSKQRSAGNVRSAAAAVFSASPARGACRRSQPKRLEAGAFVRRRGALDRVSADWCCCNKYVADAARRLWSSAAAARAASRAAPRSLPRRGASSVAAASETSADAWSGDRVSPEATTHSAQDTARGRNASDAASGARDAASHAASGGGGGALGAASATEALSISTILGGGGGGGGAFSLSTSAPAAAAAGASPRFARLRRAYLRQARSVRGSQPPASRARASATRFSARA